MKIMDQSSVWSFRSVTYQFTLSLIVGIVSLLLGLVRFELPGIEGGVSSLNEIPALVSVLYFKHPVYLVVTSAVLSLGTPQEGSTWSTFIMHVVGLVPFWFYYHRYVKNFTEQSIIYSLLIGIGVIAYYLLLVLPMMALTNIWFNIIDMKIVPFYLQVLSLLRFELVTTTIITGLFFLQYNYNQRIRTHLGELEKRVEERTRGLNELVTNLDAQLLERGQSLATRNEQLSGYAFVNSHLVRAPLARIMQLAKLMELQGTSDPELLEKFLLSCEELDQIVHLLSELLHGDNIFSDAQLADIKSRILAIAENVEISKEEG